MVIQYLDKFNELMNNAISELRTTTDITQLVPGAKARAILEIVNRELSAAYATFSVDLLQSYVKYATGSNLDFIGELVGLARKQATRNYAEVANSIQKFYVQDGNFGSINGGASFSIPAGTKVYTRVLNVEEQPITYTVTEAVVCNAASTYVYAKIRADEFGSSTNVSMGSLVLHNFENYEDYRNNTLKTRNVDSIIYATDTETDANFRYRIINQALSGEAANYSAIRLACLGVPGVADIAIEEYAYGIGTAKIYIKGVVPVISETLIANVQMVIDEKRAIGNYILAASPWLVGVEMVVSLTLYNKLEATEELALKQSVRDTIYEYLNSLDIGESLDVDDLINRIRAVDSNIKKIGTTEKPIDNLWVYKYSPSKDSRIRYEALDGYTAKSYERIVTEFTELTDNADPIRIRVI